MDAQLGTTLPKKSNPRTLSGIYVREAKIYDDGMVARWKVLMDGLLLFAALFSAVVTAFIIESYRNMSPDPSVTTVLLLYQISQQLSMITNSTELNISLPNFGSSPKLAVITNIFWFLSLSLSLTCALTATLIEQWASDYVRAIERRERPEIRARIRAYLFEGVENSNVATIVEGTPLLLHASLFSFFIGLVFFLHPINIAMTFLTAGILAVFGAAYLSATIAPLIETASPIRTPLTTLVMQFQCIRNLIRQASLCGFRVSSLMRLQAEKWIKACWTRLRKYSSAIAEIGRATMNRLLIFSAWVQSLFLSKQLQDTIDMQPSSEMQESRSKHHHLWVWLQPFKDIWSDSTLCHSSLDFIKEVTALDHTLPDFCNREIKSLSWTLEHTTNDAELLVFLEGTPLYLKSNWSNLHFGEEQVNHQSFHQHSPASVLGTVLQNPNSTFILKLETFISTRCDGSISTRDASAVVNALLSLFEAKVIPYTAATSFLHPSSSSPPFANLSSFLRRVIKQHPSLAPAVHRLESTAIVRCAQARDLEHPVKGPGDFDWPFQCICHIPDAIRQSSQLHPFWTDMLSFVGIEWLGEYHMGFTTTEGIPAAEIDRAITLLGLCICFWAENFHPVKNLNHYPFWSMIGNEFVDFVSSLAGGSARAQRAYSAGILLITLSLQRPGSPTLPPDPAPVELLWPLLKPLAQLTDDIAATTAQMILCNPEWFQYHPQIQSRWLLKNPPLNQIRGAAELCRWLRIPSSGVCLRKSLTTLAGLDSSIQIQLAEPLKYWFKYRLPRMSADDMKHVPLLFHLLGTLDDPKSMLQVQRVLRGFLNVPNLQDIAPAEYESYLEAAQEALKQLAVTASKPGFIFQALSLPEYKYCTGLYRDNAGTDVTQKSGGQDSSRIQIWKGGFRLRKVRDDSSAPPSRNMGIMRYSCQF